MTPMPPMSPSSQPGNPYRRPRPQPAEWVAGGKFYLANKNGSYGFKTSPVRLILCREYLWVSDTLTIPLGTITETGLSKHGGYIHYWDAIAGAVIAFNFTKLGMIRFRRKDVEAFLKKVDRLRPNTTPLSGTRPTPASTGLPYAPTPEPLAPASPLASTSPAEDLEQPQSFNCERCNSADTNVFVFHVFRFVGIVPFAYSYSLTPFRYALCAKHAREEAFACARRTAAAGYLGFPGFLAAPYYICKDLWSLRRARAADTRTVLLCFLFGIVLPLGIIALVIYLIFAQFRPE